MSWLTDALKGTKQQTTQQQSQYKPDPQAYAAMLAALQQGQQVSQTPFSTPQAPVAGLTPDQVAAFQQMREQQGAASPFYQRAAQYFSPQGASEFFNPMSDAVMRNMKDVFGSQMSQVTRNLTQQAGGVGADRIAVGQSELGKQQDLAAGQTLSDMYARAQQAAQNAGIGMGQTGNAYQNSLLQGTQGLYGMGSQQQQFAQTQQMAPYNQALARIQWPYMNAQFNAGITGQMAPGMGGTTNSSGTNIQTNPGGQLGNAIGLGMAAMGGIGYGMGYMPGMNGYNPISAGMGGNPFPQNAYTQGATAGYGANGPNYYPQFAGGGAVAGRGHRVSFMRHINSLHGAPIFADGGPVDDRSEYLKDAQRKYGMIKLRDQMGGPPAFFGKYSESEKQRRGRSIEAVRADMERQAREAGEISDSVPRDYADGGATTFDDRWSAMSDAFPGERPETYLPPEFWHARKRAPVGGFDPLSASADEPLQGEDDLPPGATSTMGADMPTGGNPFTSMVSQREPGFVDSPWAALTAAGLGILKNNGNIGGASEGLEHLKGNREAAWKDISVEQGAARLQQEYARHAAEFAQKERFHTDTLNAPKVMAPGASLVRPNTGETIHTAGSTLSEGAAEVAGRRLADGDAGALAGWGRGAQGAENIARINNKAIEVLTTERGMSPSEAAAHVSRATQEYKARGVGASTEARVGAGREANLKIILKAAEAAAPAAIEASEALWRTSFVPVNKIMQAFQTGTSDPALKRAGMANLQLAEHWARAMNPTGVMRESDRDYALRFLSTADSKETYRAAVDQLMTQIKREQAAVSSFRGEPGKAAPAGDPLAEARAAIARGAPREAVIERLRKNGIDPGGL